MNLKKIFEAVNSALDIARKPVSMIEASLIYATAVQRPGISKLKITSEIIANNESLGINTGQMPDGTENVVNNFVDNLVEKVVDTLKDDALVECVIPIGSIVVEAKGTNGGGPLVAIGTNINNAKGYGVIR